MLEWFKKQPVDENGKLILPKAFSGEEAISEPKTEEEIASEAWALTALRSILQGNLQDRREDFWDEQR